MNKSHILWSKNIDSSNGSKQYMTDFDSSVNNYTSINSYKYIDILGESNAIQLDIGKFWYTGNSENFALRFNKNVYVNGTFYNNGSTLFTNIYTIEIFIIIDAD